MRSLVFSFHSRLAEGEVFSGIHYRNAASSGLDLQYHFPGTCIVPIESTESFSELSLNPYKAVFIKNIILQSSISVLDCEIVI